MTQDDHAIRVLLVGNHDVPMVRQAVSEAPDLILSAEARSIDEAAELISRTAPSVIVANWTGSEDEGPVHIQALRSAFPTVHIVAFASTRDPAYVEVVLRAGALGYLSDFATTVEIAEAIRSVAGGKAYVSRRVARKILRHLMQADSGDPHTQLTRREREIFDQIGRKNVGEIADGLGLDARTVESYCRRIRAKLDLSTSAELVDYARQWQSERA